MNVKLDRLSKRIGREVDPVISSARSGLIARQIEAQGAGSVGSYFANPRGWHPVDFRPRRIWQGSCNFSRAQSGPSCSPPAWSPPWFQRLKSTWWSMARSS